MRTPRTLAITLTTVALLAIPSIPVTAQSAEPVDDPTLPSAFTGRIDFGDEVRAGTAETVDGRTESRGSAHAPAIVTMSDPRLDGDVTITFATDSYTGPDGDAYSVGIGTWRIENADGAWQGSYDIVGTDDYESVVTTTLAGEDAYAGMSAVWEQTLVGFGWVLRGVVFPAAPPDPPTAPLSPAPRQYASHAAFRQPVRRSSPERCCRAVISLTPGSWAGRDGPRQRCSRNRPRSTSQGRTPPLSGPRGSRRRRGGARAAHRAERVGRADAGDPACRGP